MNLLRSLIAAAALCLSLAANAAITSCPPESSRATAFGASSDTKAAFTTACAQFHETDTNDDYVWDGSAWVLKSSGVHLTETPAVRNASSTTNSYVVTKEECNPTRLDIDTTETLVTNAPAYVVWIVGNDGNTGYTDVINAAATGGGSPDVKLRVNLGDGTSPMYLASARFDTGITVDGESAGHDVTICWRPL